MDVLDNQDDLYAWFCRCRLRSCSIRTCTCGALTVRDQAWIPAGSPTRRSFDVRPTSRRPGKRRATIPACSSCLTTSGKPSIAASELEPWASGFRALAAEPNIASKLSGLQTIASRDWIYPELAPYIDIALDAFGPSRLIFGSDWPVSSQAAPYARVCEAAQAACSALSGDERAAVLAGNARAIYLGGLATCQKDRRASGIAI